MGIKSFVEIGKILRRIRKDNNLTQDEMADRLGLKFNTYKNYERNDRTPNKDTLNKIENEFNVDMKELIHNATKTVEPEDIVSFLQKMLYNYGYDTMNYKESNGKLRTLSVRNDEKDVHFKISRDEVSDLEERLKRFIDCEMCFLNKNKL